MIVLESEASLRREECIAPASRYVHWRFWCVCVCTCVCTCVCVLVLLCVSRRFWCVRVCTCVYVSLVCVYKRLTPWCAVYMRVRACELCICVCVCVSWLSYVCIYASGLCACVQVCGGVQ